MGRPDAATRSRRVEEAATSEEPAARPEQELYAALGAQLRTPPVVSAGIIGAGALGVCFAVALVLAALPDRSLIGFLGSDATDLEETFRQMCQLVLAGFQNDALIDILRQTDRVPRRWCSRRCRSARRSCSPAASGRGWRRFPSGPGSPGRRPAASCSPC